MKNKIQGIVENIKTRFNETESKKKIAGVTCVCAFVVCVIVGVILIGNNDESNPLGEILQPGKNENYTVSLRTQGGMALSEVGVYVYTDDKMTELIDFSSTDENGTAVFELDNKQEYYVVLSGVKKGYDVEDYYQFKDNRLELILCSELIQGGNLADVTLGLGDVMYDFSVTDAFGTKVQLSELLAEKELVVLNFWYTTCSWCVTEFPIMAEAYEMFKDEVAIVALNPLEDNTAVKQFQDSYELPFYMAACNATWATTFGISGYPTSVFIDRYGVICAVEAGAITTLRPFVSVFEHFTSDEYNQMLCVNGVADLVTQVKPTYTMPMEEEIHATINSNDIEISFRAEEGEDAEYAWPFVIGEKNGEQCIYASNQGIESSFAIMYMDVYLEEGEVLAVEYLASSELSYDIMYILVDGKDIFAISGWEEEEQWRTCYPLVAKTAGNYEVAFCYLKDSDTSEADDTVYVKDIRIVGMQDIDVATYIPCWAATTDDGTSYSYVDVYFNENDGYYHVGTADGPLLLADLLNATEFNDSQNVYLTVYDDAEFMVDGVNRFEDLEQYCNYAANSNISGLCPVTEELYVMLVEFARQFGFEDDDREWLKLCKYYEAYGTDEQLEDPIKGLASFCAYKATCGKNISTNYFYYNRPIMPRGLFAEFIPEVSGVYRITSRNDSEHGVDGWIFDENRTELMVYAWDERMYAVEGEVSMLYYMEAGKPYYINIAFWDTLGNGTIYYDIEYVAEEYYAFKLGSPGYFTYDTNATGEAMYYLIAGGVDVVLREDGIYCEDLGLDSNGNQRYGSEMYCDFVGITGLFSNPIMSNNGVKGMIDMGGFDFSKSENDDYIISIIEQYETIAEADAYLRETWGEDYDSYAELYQLEDVYDGKYHGNGEDYTEIMRQYCLKLDASGKPEREGCVLVTEELADILQLLMDKFTFKNVEHSWTKLCYYYDYYGPEDK